MNVYEQLCSITGQDRLIDAVAVAVERLSKPEPRRARRSDPATSHAEAKRWTWEDLSNMDMRIVGALKATLVGTSRSVAQELGEERVSVSPRFAPLERHGIIRKTGQKGPGGSYWGVGLLYQAVID
jgi:hypothetical protein